MKTFQRYFVKLQLLTITSVVHCLSGFLYDVHYIIAVTSRWNDDETELVLNTSGLLTEEQNKATVRVNPSFLHALIETLD